MNIDSRQKNGWHLELLSRPFSRLHRSVRQKIGEALYERRYRKFRPNYSRDAIVHGIDEHVASLATFLERGNIETFLKRLNELMGKLLSDNLKGRALFIPRLDELNREASLILAPHRNAPPRPNVLVHVATAVYPIGGHTRVMEDIVAALPDHQHALIITAMHGSHPDLASLRPRFDDLNLSVHLLQSSGWAERARELSSLIDTLGPHAVLLLANHDDSVAYSAVAGDAERRVLFLHHADHQPTLGAFRADYTHIDLTPACHRVCASHPRLHASLINLTAEDIGTVKASGRRDVVGVTCGSPHKYVGSSKFSYAELLTALLSAGVNQVFHIGDMPEQQKVLIGAEIMAGGQDARRVVFLPNTPSLAAKLIEISPDFYFTSHPVGSGKATVEALSVGLPIFFICPPETPPLVNPDMTFGASISVSALEHVPGVMRRLELEKRTLASRSREIYEKYYSPNTFREALLLAINSELHH